MSLRYINTYEIYIFEFLYLKVRKYSYLDNYAYWSTRLIIGFICESYQNPSNFPLYEC